MEVSFRFPSLAHPKDILYYLQIYTKEITKKDINWSPFLNACSLLLGLVLSLFNFFFIFSKTRRKNFKFLGGWPLPPLVKSSSTWSSSGGFLQWYSDAQVNSCMQGWLVWIITVITFLPWGSSSIYTFMFLPVDLATVTSKASDDSSSFWRFLCLLLGVGERLRWNGGGLTYWLHSDDQVSTRLRNNE